MKRNLFFCFLIILSLKNFCQSCVSCNSTQSINSNLIACYPFNGNTNDETGNGNNAVMIGNSNKTTSGNRSTFKTKGTANPNERKTTGTANPNGRKTTGGAKKNTTRRTSFK